MSPAPFRTASWILPCALLADMAVGTDGRIFLLDAQARRVHVVDPAGGPALGATA